MSIARDIADDINVGNVGLPIKDSNNAEVLAEDINGVVTLTADAAVIEGSSSGDLVRITQTGSGNALVVEDSTNPDSTPFVVDASGNVGIGTSSPSSPSGTSLTVFDTSIPRINFKNSTTGDTSTAGGEIRQSGNQFLIGNRQNSDLIFNTNNTERMRIDSSGRLLVSPEGNAGTYAIRTTGDRYYNRYPLELEDVDQYTAYTGLLIYFKRNGTEVGKIQCTGSSTSYVTSSDYRLKENITEITDGITRVKQLNPSRFNFIINPETTVDGFIAHEVSDVVPEAVSGEKDAVNEDGSIRPQGIDQSKLVPLLTAALQESIAIIESQQSQIDALTARIEALESNTTS
jgi:hypothetical protein